LSVPSADTLHAEDYRHWHVNLEGNAMLRFMPVLWILFSGLASAATAQAEEPMTESNMTAVWVFVAVVVVCLLWFGWYLWRNSKKRPEELEGEKF
jgi:hypothetical protein